MAPEPAAKSENAKASWPPAFLWFVRIAIVAVALYNLWDFLDWLGSLNVSGGIGKTLYAVQNFVFVYILNPICSLVAIVLAVMGRRLKLAALLAAVPHIHFWLNVVAFGIGVMMYGF